MMRSFREIVKELKEKHSETDFSQCPQKEYIYYFYYNGKLIHKTNDPNDPLIEEGWITEKVHTNKKEIDDYWNKLKEVEKEAIEIFKNQVRQEYCHLSDDLFELCWWKSYDDNHSSGYDEVANGMWRHSSGYDEVANGMWRVVDFAQSVIETTKRDFINNIKNIKPKIIDDLYGPEPSLYDMISLYYNHYVDDSELAKKHRDEYIKIFLKGN